MKIPRWQRAVFAVVIGVTALGLIVPPAQAATAAVVCRVTGPVCDRETTPLSDGDSADPSAIFDYTSGDTSTYQVFSSADEYAGTSTPSADHPTRDDITREKLSYSCAGTSCTWISGPSYDAVGAPRWDTMHCPMQAPGVFKVGNRYVMWFDMANRQAPESCFAGPFLVPPPADAAYYCLYYATASSLVGNWSVPDTSPVVCSPDGAIDPQPFSHDGANYLLWKEGNVTGGPAATIEMAKLDAAGTALVPNSTVVIASQLAYTGPTGSFGYYIRVSTLEAPAPLITASGDFELLFSAGNWKTSGYQLGLVNCGPWDFIRAGSCDRTPIGDAPILASNDFPPRTNLGPGSGSIVRTPNGTAWIVYAAWDGCTGYWNSAGDCTFGERRVHVAELRVG
ncbi:MAG: family 43 glycosylhydrolase [Acidimicrobiales bacterium]